MKGSRALLSQALSVMKSNIERTGDPLGFQKDYWSSWAEGLELPRQGKIMLLTGRMYQMLPYVSETTNMVTRMKPLLAVRSAGKILEMGRRLAGEKAIRLKARGAKEIKKRGVSALRGVVSALKAAGIVPAYLYDEEPYSGVLLYDVGLEKEVIPHAEKVHGLLKRHGVEEVITLDPHTTFVMREVYPKGVRHYDLRVRHYLEILTEKGMALGKKEQNDLPDRFVIHDSCVMARDLHLTRQPRELARSVDVEISEPENSGVNTACCGGPVEYAFGELSCRISAARSRELVKECKQVLVSCPICLLNLSKHERELGMRVWDLGEVLDRAYLPRASKTDSNG